MTLSLSGIAAAPGIAIGAAYVLERQRVEMPRPLVPHGRQIPEEVARFRWAVRSAHTKLSLLRDRLANSTSSACLDILDAQLELLADPALVDATIYRIRHKGLVAEWALTDTFAAASKQASSAASDAASPRIADLECIEQRLLRHLGYVSQEDTAEVPAGSVIVARELTPADTAQMDPARIMGFVTQAGGPTSHTAIVARSLGLPAVVGVEFITELVSTGDQLIVDGSKGNVLIEASPETRADYSRRQVRQLEADALAIAQTSPPAPAGSRLAVKTLANIQSRDGLSLALAKGADGIGLFRTEFLFMNRAELPGEDEQYEIYREVGERVAPAELNIRTLDIGGDKLPRRFRRDNPANSALGLRGIRFSLRHQDLFKAQLRAILRASRHAPTRIILPMVSGLDEVDAATRLLIEVRNELRAEGESFARHLPIGVMIEVPAAVMLAEQIAARVDFLCVGTNDLIQYTLAIDRANEQVAYLYEPLHPAVLRMLAMTISAAQQAKIPVTVCGEMAGDVHCLPVLLALGVSRISMNALAIPATKQALRALSPERVRALADVLFTFTAAKELRSYLQAQFSLSSEIAAPERRTAAPILHHELHA